LRGERRVWKAAALVTALVLATTVPFLGKPVHIDDVYFVEVARGILEHPLRPLGGVAALEDIDYRVFASGGRCPSTFASMSHPPLVPYWLAASAWAAGGFSEMPLHLAFLPFAVGAAWAMLHLSRRFSDHPVAAAVLTVGSPIFVLASQSLSTDMAALAFTLGSLSLLVEGIDRDRRWLVWLAGALSGLGAVTRYSTLAVLPLLLLYGLLQRKLRETLPATAAFVMVFGAWCAQNLAFHGQLHIVASSRHYQQFFAGRALDLTAVVRNALADLSAIGATAFLAAAFLLLIGGRRRWLTLLAAATAAAAVFVLRPPGIERLDTYSGWEAAAVCAAFALGVSVVVEGLGADPAAPGSDPSTANEERRDRMFLLAWLGLTLAGTLLLLPFGTARYMLPALPPLWLSVVRRAERRRLAAPERWAFAGAVVQSVSLAFVLSLADAESAARYREVALELREDQPAKTLWFVGEWGFRHYMGLVGGRYLSSADVAPQPGDLIVRPWAAGMHEMAASVRQRTVLIQDIPLGSRWPVRLMSFEAKAGYYSHHWGFLPWTVSRAPLERIQIYEVRVPAPPREKVTCASS